MNICDLLFNHIPPTAMVRRIQSVMIKASLKPFQTFHIRQRNSTTLTVMSPLLRHNSISTQLEHRLPSTVTHSTTSTTFNIWEYLTLFILPSAAAAIYAVLHIKFPTTTHQAIIPFTMFILVGMVLLRTPREYYTTIFLTMQLAGITILVTSNCYSTFLTYIGSYGFWHVVVHAFLSIKGVKCEEMGCMGDIEHAIAAFSNWIANWMQDFTTRIVYGIQFIVNGIASGIQQISNAIVNLGDAIKALGNTIVALGNTIKAIVDGVKNAIVVIANGAEVADSIANGITLDHDKEARPPPYDISTLSSNKQHHMPDRKGLAWRCSF